MAPCCFGGFGVEVAAGAPGRFGGFGVEVAAGGSGGFGAPGAPGGVSEVSERRAGARPRSREKRWGAPPPGAEKPEKRPRGAGRGETTRPPAADGTEKPEKRPGARRRTERRNRRICMEPCTEKPECLQARPGMEKPEKRQCGFR